jgi:hypothetical protein
MSFISGQHTYDQHVERKAQQVNWYFSSSQSVIRETSTCQARKKTYGKISNGTLSPTFEKGHLRRESRN